MIDSQVRNYNMTKIYCELFKVFIELSSQLKISQSYLTTTTEVLKTNLANLQYQTLSILNTYTDVSKLKGVFKVELV